MWCTRSPACMRISCLKNYCPDSVITDVIPLWGYLDSAPRRQHRMLSRCLGLVTLNKSGELSVAFYVANLSTNISHEIIEISPIRFHRDTGNPSWRTGSIDIRAGRWWILLRKRSNNLIPTGCCPTETRPGSSIWITITAIDFRKQIYSRTVFSYLQQSRFLAFPERPQIFCNLVEWLSTAIIIWMESVNFSARSMGRTKTTSQAN